MSTKQVDTRKGDRHSENYKSNKKLNSNQTGRYDDGFFDKEV